MKTNTEDTFILELTDNKILIEALPLENISPEFVKYQLGRIIKIGPSVNGKFKVGDMVILRAYVVDSIKINSQNMFVTNGYNIQAIIPVCDREFS